MKYLILLSSLLFSLAAPAAGSAVEVHLVLSNDALTLSPRPDDLYSFGLRLEVSVGRNHVALEERGFTDRRAGLRFDETYLTAGRWISGQRFGLDSSWQIEAVAGIAVVGEGLLGASAQNTLHGWLGDTQLELDYLEQGDPMAHARISVVRLPASGRMRQITPWMDLEVTEGFQTSLAIGGRFHWRATRRLLIEGAIGLRHSQTDFEALRPHVSALTPTFEIASRISEGLRLVWTYNTFGTGDQHWHVALRPGRFLRRASGRR